MTTQFQFKIQNLLSVNGNVLSGPMSPFLFAKEMTKYKEETFNRLARIRFTDESIFQNREEGGLTGHDILIIGSEIKNDLLLSLWIDEGVRGVPVAMAFQSEREIILTPIYQKKNYARKLSGEQIQEIFNYLFDHSEILTPTRENDIRPDNAV
jgi:hypothetical protein